MNYANAAFNASDHALYIASHRDDNDDGDDQGRREEEIEEEHPATSCRFANYLYTNKTLLPLCHLCYCFSPQAYATYELTSLFSININ